MSKNDYTEVRLAKGNVRVYDFGGVKLHAYETCDPIDDEVFVVEKDGRGFVIELPCFFDNITALEGYIADAGIRIEGVLAAYHMAGGTFLPGAPVFSTANADAYGRAGGGKALIDGFAQAFGDAFDSSLPESVTIIEGGEFELADVKMNIVVTPDAFDIELPEIGAVYTHMLGHDCHSIVAGADHADAIIAQLEGYKQAGIGLVLTSHHMPEDLEDAQTKIDYLQELKALAAGASDAADFKARVQERYPEYAGENYLDMTAGFFFAR